MYLKKTFREAFKFSKPDVVIFLGDLMDEGSTATNEEFYSYVRRVFHIFLDPDKYVQVIFCIKSDIILFVHLEHLASWR